MAQPAPMQQVAPRGPAQFISRVAQPFKQANEVQSSLRSNMLFMSFIGGLLFVIGHIIDEKLISKEKNSKTFMNNLIMYLKYFCMVFFVTVIILLVYKPSVPTVARAVAKF